MATRSSIGPEDYEDLGFPKRGYTTRGKLEQQRTAAPIFTGRVRRWEKKWVKQGHLTVMKWEHVSGEEKTLSGTSPAPGEVNEPAQKRSRVG